MPTPTSEPTGLADSAINTEVSNFRRWISISVLLILLVAVRVAVYTRSKPPRFDGWWLMQSGGGSLPDQMTLHVSDGVYSMRYWDDGGVTTETVPMDGQVHVMVTPSNSALGGAKTTCSAQRIGRSLVIKKELATFAPGASVPLNDLAWTETWSLTPDGHRLVISTPNRADVVYVRPSLWVHLWRSAP